MKIDIFQVDAFNNEKFKGNPAAVCPLAFPLSDPLMQAIAMENNLSETAFYYPLDNGDFHLRWFTPNMEVELCGHATLATAHVIFNELNHPEDTIFFQTKSGRLVVNKKQDSFVMDFPANPQALIETPSELEEALGAEVLACYKGTDLLVVVKDEATVRNLTPNFNTLLNINYRGYLVTAKGGEVDFVSRCFFPKAGINEDPVTGSAHTKMVPYWAKELNKQSFIAHQISPRGGILNCELVGDRVILEGQAALYMKGEIYV